MGNNHVYILTNYNRTTLYIGVTSDLRQRLGYHWNGLSQFTNRYNCKYLIYYEHFPDIQNAIYREKQLKRWSRLKKERLIATLNPSWDFLNDQFI
jgi:putative endonuclease